VSRNLVLSVVAYAALALMVVGALNLFVPLRRFGLTRARGLMMFGAGALVLLAFPLVTRPPHRRAAPAATRLDAIIPEWSFAEQHEIDVAAAPEAIDRAIREVSAGEIRLFRTLTWIRAPRRRTEDILRPGANRPILDVATSSTFALLADEPGREIVVGTLIGPPLGHPPTAAELSADRPGYARAIMNFRIEPRGPGLCRLVTETRVSASDPSVERRFDSYWRLIYPGSSIIRYEWLRAIKRRAESGPPTAALV
jgi:hypothetical protein